MLKTLTALIRKASRRLEVDELYAAYGAKCRQEGAICLERSEFLDKLGDICIRAGITCAVDGGKAYPDEYATREGSGADSLIVWAAGESQATRSTEG